eukprot:TRINITY_DN7940_c0_g1_i1.p1 TRINITY_DN7940_c0_g1~~TRINITY_DN7940_c0_g1_i1.p1  ORF type:complete len:159 (+),score=27.93 TRINITY_DN7940_c0_g1_i1:130-606(+)
MNSQQLVLTKFLNGSLSGSELYDTINFETFKKSFPLKYHEHPQVKELFIQYEIHRKNLKQQVNENIKREYQNEYEIHYDENRDYESYIPKLETHQEIIEKKLKSINKQIKEKEKAIQLTLNGIENINNEILNDDNQLDIKTIENIEMNINEINNLIEN